MNVTNVALGIEYVSTALSLFCLPINIIFVYVVFQERKHAPFGSPFFRLCIHLSVADILCCLFTTFFFKFPMFGVFPLSFYQENWSVIPLVGVNYLGHAQAIGIIFIAVNRFTAVYFPIRHKQNWWTPMVTTILLVLQWTIPVLFVIPLFFTQFHFVFQRNAVVFSADDDTFHRSYFIGLALLDGVFINIIVSVLYIAIFIRVACRNRGSVKPGLQKQAALIPRRVQTRVVVKNPGEIAMRLALSAFVIFISYLCLGVFSVLSAISPPSDAWMYRTLWFVVNDVLCASNAPILLALNRPVRQVFLRKIGVNVKPLVNKGGSLLATNA